MTVVDKQVTEGPTKTHQRRDIAIDEALGAFLARRRAEQERYAEAVGVPLVGDPFVLSRSADGSTPWLPDGLSHQYQRLTSRLGLSDPFPRTAALRGHDRYRGGADVQRWRAGSVTPTPRSRCGCMRMPWRLGTGS